MLSLPFSVRYRSIYLEHEVWRASCILQCFSVCSCIDFSGFFVLIIAWKMRAYWRKHGGTVFKFANNGIQAATGLYNATIAWAAIERVRFSKEFVFLFTSARAVFIVPRRAFSGSDEQGFLAMAGSRRA